MDVDGALIALSTPMNASVTLKRTAAINVEPAVSRPAFRGGYRVLAESRSVSLTLGSRGLVGVVSELSPEHVVMQWPEGALMPMALSTAARLTVVGHEDLPFEVRIGARNLRDKASDVGLEIVSPSRELGRSILDRAQGLVASGLASSDVGRPATREVIDGKARMRDVLGALARNGAQGVIRVGNFAVGRVMPTRIDGDEIEWDLDGPEVSGPVVIELTGYNSLFVIELTTEWCRHGALTTSMPTRIVRLRNRAHRRIPIAAGSFVEFEHPLWGDRKIRRAVRELSASGLSFATDPAEDLLYPGLLASNMELHSGGRTMRFLGEVRSLLQSRDESPGACGLRVYPDSAVDESAWTELVEEQLHPTTRMGSSFCQATWSLYEKAGYFELSGKDPEYFDRLGTAFEVASRRIEDAPQIGCQVVWPNPDGQIEAAMSMLKVYSSAWLVFQLAKITGATRTGVSSRAVLRELHLHCYEHAQRDPSLKWLIGIPQVKSVWSRIVHYDLPARHVAEGNASIVRFRAVEVKCEGELQLARRLPTGLATAAEVDTMLSVLERTRPRPHLEALDLVPEAFDISNLEADWALAGFARRRAVLVARKDGVAIAAAILESADEGLHLYRLLDSVRMVSLVEGGTDAFGSLLAGAQDWFRKHDKPSFVAYLEDDVAIPEGCDGIAQDLGLADFVVLSAELLPELLEHVVEVTAPRELTTGLRTIPRAAESGVAL